MIIPSMHWQQSAKILGKSESSIMAHLNDLSLNSLCSALALPLRRHNQVYSLQSASSSDLACLTAVPAQASLQLISLPTVEAAIPPPDNVHAAAAHR